MARSINPDERLNPAHSIIEACGGVTRTAELTGCTEAWVHRWTYPPERGGTAGRIPHKAAQKLLEARARGDVAFEPAALLGVAAE